MRSYEKVYFNSQDYFDELFMAISKAKNEILIETYIFKEGEITHKLFEALKKATSRGVKVKMIVDGAGGYGDIDEYSDFCTVYNIQLKIYHPILLLNLLRTFQFINRRNHRKLCLIDSTLAFAGSLNLTDAHIKHSWKDFGISFKGPGVFELKKAFEKTFDSSKLVKTLKNAILLKNKNSTHSAILLNDSVLKRHECHKFLINRIKRARKRIWLANAYILPEIKVQHQLEAAARRGVDVRLLTSGDTNDVFFMPWLSRLYYKKNLEVGIKHYEYTPSFFHGKVFIIDDFVSVGSSNLNHRSLFHDLELDVIVTRNQNKIAIIKDLEKAFLDSKQIDESDIKKIPIFKQYLARVLYLLRYWF